MNLKEHFQKLKRWQSNAFDYGYDKNELHHCANCENNYAGNYCPHCSQKAGTGKISWKSVIEGALEVWGMHSRSLPYTLMQLVLRPGHMISDYINGKRQVSFPPVKMLLILGIISVAVDSVFVIGDALTSDLEPVLLGEWRFLHKTMLWVKANPGWGWLMISSYFLIPTWAIFRYSPKNPYHTLPQGFFIQVFLSMHVLLIDDFADITSDVFYALIPLCYTYVNKQLFGHGLWGTIWRTLAVMVSGLFLALSGNYLYGMIVADNGLSTAHSLLRWSVLVMTGIALTIISMGITRLCAQRKKAHNTQASATDLQATEATSPQPQSDK